MACARGGSARIRRGLIHAQPHRGPSSTGEAPSRVKQSEGKLPRGGGALLCRWPTPDLSSSMSVCASYLRLQCPFIFHSGLASCTHVRLQSRNSRTHRSEVGGGWAVRNNEGKESGRLAAKGWPHTVRIDCSNALSNSPAAAVEQRPCIHGRVRACAAPQMQRERHPGGGQRSRACSRRARGRRRQDEIGDEGVISWFVPGAATKPSRTCRTRVLVIDGTQCDCGVADAAPAFGAFLLVRFWTQAARRSWCQQSMPMHSS